MPSAIDATKPVDNAPALTSDLRANLLTAKNEITALQAADALKAARALSNLASVAINADLVGAVSGGMGIRGGSTANDDLILEGTTHATRTTSFVVIQPNGGNVGIGATTPPNTLSIGGTNTGLRIDNADSGLGQGANGIVVGTVTANTGAGAAFFNAGMTIINAWQFFAKGGGVNFVVGRASLRDNMVLHGDQASVFFPGPNAGATLPSGNYSLMAASGTDPTFVPMVARAAASQTANLQEWQNSGGTALASVNASGNLTAPDGGPFAPSYSFGSETSTGVYKIAARRIGVAVNGVPIFGATDNGGVNLTLNGGVLNISGAGVGNNGDVGVSRAAAGVLAVGTGTAGSTAGTVSCANVLTSSYHRTNPVTVATLTAAATAGNGARHAVTDSTVAASGNFGAAVAGGGANNVPVVVSNGVWVIG